MRKIKLDMEITEQEALMIADALGILEPEDVEQEGQSVDETYAVLSNLENTFRALVEEAQEA